MRLLLLSSFTLFGAFYGLAAYHSFREETAARATPSPTREAHRHPEANLRAIREAFASDDYSDDLLPLLERSLEEAPTFYQPAFLLANFHANRLEHPERVRAGFETALARFPSNGRLHLSFAEWLLAPRPTAPYRRFRDERSPEERETTRELALSQIERATHLEPDLTERALGVILRARLPAEAWSERLPRTNETRRLLLAATDRSPRDRPTRERLLRELLAEPAELTLDRSVAQYAARWGFPELALAAAGRWHRSAVESGTSEEIRRATTALMGRHLDDGESDRAYEILRQTLRTLEDERVSDAEIVELLSSAGELYVSRGRKALAQGLFSEAVTLSPHHVPSRLGLARLYSDSGDPESARDELERVLALDPTNERARALFERLER